MSITDVACLLIWSNRRHNCWKCLSLKWNHFVKYILHFVCLNRLRTGHYSPINTELIWWRYASDSSSVNFIRGGVSVIFLYCLLFYGPTEIDVSVLELFLSKFLISCNNFRVYSSRIKLHNFWWFFMICPQLQQCNFRNLFFRRGKKYPCEQRLRYNYDLKMIT